MTVTSITGMNNEKEAIKSIFGTKTGMWQRILAIFGSHAVEIRVINVQDLLKDFLSFKTCLVKGIVFVSSKSYDLTRTYCCQ